MRYVTRWAAFLIVAGFALPLPAADDKKADDKKPAADKKADDKKPDDKKPDDKKGDDKKPADKKMDPKKEVDVKKELEKNTNTDKSIRAGQLTGKIVAVVESKKSLRLSIPLQVPHLNAGELQAAADEEARYKLAVLQNNASAAAQHLYNMQVHQSRIYSLHTTYKDVELQTTDDVKVRLANPPPKFDEKGKIVRLSAKELKDLKGPDPRLPGYSGEFSDLAQEQVVTVTLVKKKGDGLRLPPAPKGKPGDPTALLEDLPQVNMIVVLVDPNANPAK